MADEKDGGPVFPVGERSEDRGMALRDYFAAATMQSLVVSKGGYSDDAATKRRAGQAYRFADAMLEARRK